MKKPDPGQLWQELLWRRTGWFGLQIGGRMATVLVCYQRGSMWGISLEHLATARGRTYIFPQTETRLRRLVRPLRDLVVGEVGNVFELCLSGSVADGNIMLNVAHAAQVVAPVPQPTRSRRTRASAPAPGEAEADAPAEEDPVTEPGQRQ